MQYTKDIFISYAHIDNQPLTPGEVGWISRFHATLQALLNMRLGHPARIWRDEKLQGNDVFSDEIMDQFGKTAVLLSVLSPRYVNSEWCTREINEFCSVAEQEGGVVIDNKARLFKVLKTPVDTEAPLPSVAQSILGYEFFAYENEVPLELDAAYGEEYGQAYKRKVAQLASDLSRLLKELESNELSGNAGSGAERADTMLSVYLAECSYDQRESREIIAGELRQHGYNVLPDRSLPRDEADYIDAVNTMLETCACSIHLIGNTYGAVPDGPSHKSVSELQNELAVNRSKRANGEFKRIIWVPPHLSSEQAQQQAFIDALHHDAMSQFGADLITTDLESLKTSIHATLKKLQSPDSSDSARAASPDGEKLVYLICDQKDRKQTVPLRKFLREQGIEVAIPAFEGDASAIRQHHLQMIRQCDAVLLFYGSGDEAWKRAFDMELKKAPGYRTDRPPLPVYTFLSSPVTADKEELIDLEEPNLIEALTDFHADAMQDLLQTLGSARETA